MKDFITSQSEVGQNGIMIKRLNKKDAVHAYLSYVKIGKDCEWHGCWNGKKFDEAAAPSLK